ncbi:MAG: DUF1800 domain-containing protein [bacterium]|nr:DUF1800 domain-containing protein [bacterium]
MTTSSCRVRVAATTLLAFSSVAMAQTPMEVAVHVMNRIGYGPTPFEVAPLLAGPAAVDSYIQAQLNPGPVTNFVAVELLTQVSYPALEGSYFPIAELQLDTLIRAAYSEWQLQEVMTRFWNEHFNRSHQKNQFVFNVVGGIQNGADYSAWHLWQEDEFYRDHALGFFDDLLTATARSVSMQFYLDNHLNRAGAINENWARELMELYTMGEVNRSLPAPSNRNYTQADVVGVARCFTGWTVQVGAGPTFAPSYGLPAEHDSLLKDLFVGLAHPLQVLAGGTAQFDGDRVIAHLAQANATKDFMCRKLMTLFLGDNAGDQFPNLLRAAVLRWGPRGDITAVVNEILTSSEFVNAATAWQKTKSPLHFNTSLIRALYAVPDVNFGATLDRGRLFVHGFSTFGMGQVPFLFPSPDGYPLASARQIGVSGFLDRINSAQRVHPEPNDVFFGGQVVDVVFSPHIWAINDLTLAQLANTGDIADYLLMRHLGDKPIPVGDRSAVIAKLTPLGSPTFADDVREACEFIASLTAFKVH